MVSPRSLVCLALAALSLPACMFTGVSTEQKLRDAVVGINDEMRWNRVDLAVQRVAPAFRARFRASRLQWHEDFQIADTEIVHVEVGEGRENAISLVMIRWYDQRNMIVAETTLRQRWKKVIGGYVMTEEEVASGDPRLLELPEELREAFEEAESQGAPTDGEEDADEEVAQL
ncbi:MAG: hypothetical protein AAF938_08760 [Myxococcota bacterium]